MHVCVSLPALHPLGSDTTSITWWPFEPTRGFGCVSLCVCVCLYGQTCLLQNTHFAAPLCPLVLPWDAHRMLAYFDALFSSAYCRHTHLYRKANNSSEGPVIFLKFVTLSQPSHLKTVDFLSPKQSSLLSDEASVNDNHVFDLLQCLE